MTRKIPWRKNGISPSPIDANLSGPEFSEFTDRQERTLDSPLQKVTIRLSKVVFRISRFMATCDDCYEVLPDSAYIAALSIIGLRDLHV
jgi:hypothetical protein